MYLDGKRLAVFTLTSIPANKYNHFECAGIVRLPGMAEKKSCRSPH
jgi:hypothetical protein